MRILLTGATGYVGGCLLDELERRGLTLRCLVRRPEKLAGRTSPGTEIVQGDAADPADLARACAEIDVAYWLVHSMEGGVDFERADRLAAERFAAAATAAGVKRIVYLGGLGADDDRLSAHLRSRHEVGAILRASGLDVIEFRASIIIGAGSFSFDLVRTLVERLPVMICPAWLATPTQPIAIADVVAYLAAAADLPPGGPRIFEIGGPDKVSYGAIMQEYARQRGLWRLMIPVPVLTPRLSGLWLKLVAPRYSKVGRKLIDGLKNPTVVTNDAARREFARVPRNLRTAIGEAIRSEDEAFADRPGPTARRPLRGGTAATRRAAGWSTIATPSCRSPRSGRSRPSSGSAVPTAGTPATGCGRSAAGSTASSAARACRGGVAIRAAWPPAECSTAGGSRPASRRAGCGWRPR